MSEQEKKLQRIYDLFNAETKPRFLCQPYTKKSGRLNKKRKEGFLTAVTTAIKKNPNNVNKVGDLCRGWPEGSLFNRFHTEE